MDKYNGFVLKNAFKSSCFPKWSFSFKRCFFLKIEFSSQTKAATNSAVENPNFINTANIRLCSFNLY